MLTLPLMLLLSVMSGPTTSKEILAYQGVIFKSEGEIAFSDSEWVVVTDFTFNPLETVIKTLHDVLGRKVNTLNFRYEGPNDGFKKRIKEEVEERARAEFKNLKKSQERLRELKQAVNLGSTRKKRDLIDGGGKVLNWLFGVSTEEDLEHVNNHVEKLSTETTSIAHALEVHASLINETLWETKATSSAVEELQNAFEKLEREAWKTDHKIDGITQEVEKHEIARTAIENTFREIKSALAWLDESIEDFAVGLATMAMERLPALLFPPMQIQAVLKEIKAILPSGWSLSPSIQMGDTWQVYKDAKVAVAAVENNLRIFIHLPVFEFPFGLTLYEVISLPRPTKNATQGAQFHPLPAFLAVANDRQTFIELSTHEAHRCMMTTTSICPISKAINKRHREPSCAMALFLKDEKRSRVQCSTNLSPWTGQQTVYLGHRRWGYTSAQEMTITITCPNSRGKTNTVIKREPFDVFEVPATCTAYTEHWIFQASFKKNVKHSLNNITLPPLSELENADLIPQEYETRNMETAEPEMRKWKNRPQTTSKASIQSRVTLMGEHLRIIEEEEKERKNAERTINVRYPFEIIAIIATLFLSLAIALFLSRRQNKIVLSNLTKRVNELESQLKKHEEEVEEQL
ncbi:hypothetical protein GHT06_018513 [Daphnia sinensis]|uniref:Uncharacterized protein n=1 Tax=Daphnia sinensis TaxID=1820382 RepID=A0AAD5PUT8_9CRUS|nr:hypothetical protein GHT06_018513 [Daphnia sinensis]